MIFFSNFTRKCHAFSQNVFSVLKNLNIFQGEITDAVAGAAKIGLDATQEVARIGIQAASAAPSILNQKLELAQGLGKTVSDTSGLVKKVFLHN